MRESFRLKWAEVLATTQDVDFSLDPLDPKFVAPKPRQEIDEKKVLQLEKEGNAIYTVKRDGHRHHIVITKKEIKIYTRSLIDATDKYPHIVDQIKKMKFPYNTMLDTEILVFIDDTKEDVTAMSSITSASAERAIEFQKTKPASVMIFDIIAFDNKVMLDTFYKVRFDMIWWFFRENNYLPEDIFPVEVVPYNFEEAKEFVRNNKLEGLVIYDAYGTTEYRLDGKEPKRPKTCGKWKPLKEDDFIVRDKIFHDKAKTDLKEVVLVQIDGHTGEEFYCAKVGTFTREMRDCLTKAKLPLVMQVEFVGRHKSLKLREPRFMRLRDDKKPSECIYNAE